METTPPPPVPVRLVADPGSARILLEPTRLRILEHLRTPDTAAGCARALGESRQRIGYHVRELERGGFLVTAEERRRGAVVERVLRRAAGRFVLAPELLGPLPAGPHDERERFSPARLAGVAARTAGEVARLVEERGSSGRRPPTLVLERGIRFRSPREQAAFAEEAERLLDGLAERYHCEGESGGRPFRIFLAGHPLPEG